MSVGPIGIVGAPIGGVLLDCPPITVLVDASSLTGATLTGASNLTAATLTSASNLTAAAAVSAASLTAAALTAATPVATDGTIFSDSSPFKCR